MIRHIVMFKTKDTEDGTAYENAVRAMERAKPLADIIPSIRKMDVKVNSRDADRTNYDLVLICDFDDMAGLDEYQNHPDHKAFGKFLAGVRAEGGRACIDYEF